MRLTVGCSRGCPAELHYELHRHGGAGHADAGRASEDVTAPRRVFCIMGLLTDGAQWWPQVEALASKQHGYTLLTFDNRGVGRSSAPPHQYKYTTSMMAADAFELLEHVGWAPATTHLAGVSMGGMIALEMLTEQGKRQRSAHGARRDPFLSASLIVTTPTGPLRSPLTGSPPLPFFTTLGRQLFDPRLTTAERKMLDMELNFDPGWLAADSGHLHPTTAVPMTNAKRVTRVGAKIYFGKKEDGFKPSAGTTGTIGQLMAGATHHISTRKLGTIRDSGTTVLVVGATHDKLVRLSSGAEVLAASLDPYEYLLCDSGHAVNVQCADQVNAAMLRLFAAASGQLHGPRAPAIKTAQAARSKL